MTHSGSKSGKFLTISYLHYGLKMRIFGHFLQNNHFIQIRLIINSGNWSNRKLVKKLFIYAIVQFSKIEFSAYFQPQCVKNMQDFYENVLISLSWISPKTPTMGRFLKKKVKISNSPWPIATAITEKISITISMFLAHLTSR